MNGQRGLFITLSGGEGSGKSTLACSLAVTIEALYGVSVYCTKQPGGTPFGAQLREILLHSTEGLSPLEELYLFCADRSYHAPIIEEHIMKGGVVICDRYADETVAYQGYGRGLDLSFVTERSWEAARGVTPDRSYFCMVDPDTGLARANRRADANTRFDDEKFEFHQRVFAGFEAIADENQGRVCVVDANPTRDVVFSEIFTDLTNTYRDILEGGW